MARGRYLVFAMHLGSSCPLLDGLEEIQALDEDLYTQTAQVLYLELPHKGRRFSSRVHATTKTVEYWGISSICLGGWPGPAARILWFFDDEHELDPRRFVLVDAFWKVGNSASGDVLLRDRFPRASKIKSLYFKKKYLGEVEPFEGEDDEE